MAEKEDRERLRYLQLKAKAGQSVSTIEPEQPEKKGFLSTYARGLGEFVTEDIPGAVKGVFERTRERTKRIEAPTELGKLTGGKPGGIIEGIAGAPERAIRTTLGGFGSAGEISGVTTELIMTGINRLAGSIPGDLLNKAIEKGVKSKPGKSVVKKVSDWWNNLDEDDKANYGSMTDILDMIGFKGVGSAVAQAVKPKQGFTKTLFANFSEVPSEALEKATDKKTFSAVSEAVKETGGDLFRTAEKLNEKVASTRKQIDNIIQEIEDLKKIEFDKDVLKGKPAKLEASDVGLEIKEAATTARKKAGKRFERMQSYILEEKRGYGKGAGKISTEGRGGKNILQNEVDGFLKRIKYDEKLGVGRAGNRVIPKEAVAVIKSMYEQFGNAKNLEDALFMRRLLDQKIDFGVDGKRLFERGSDSDWAMKEVRNKFNDAIEKKLRESLMGETLVKSWRINNKQYAEVATMLSNVEQSIKMGKTSSESYIGKINKIGIDKLTKMAKLSQTDDYVKPVFNELKRGYFDNLILSSIDNQGLNFDSFVKTWKSMDSQMKTIMIDSVDIKRVDDAIKNFKPEKITPSTFGSELVSKKLSGDRTTRILENIGSKSHREGLEQLRVLDDLLGNVGDKRVSDLAEKVYLGKQLKMTPEGKLPPVTDIRTGKSKAFLTAGAAAGAAKGAAIGGPSGAFVGTLAGALTGIYMQSPAAALAAYKILNKIDVIGDVTKGTAKRLTKLPGSKVKGAVRGAVEKAEKEEEEYNPLLRRRYR